MALAVEQLEVDNWNKSLKAMALAVEQLEVDNELCILHLSHIAVVAL